ncbi:CocE/NonD family hydrolase [Geitlerinema calcuttense]|uniref:CocE/NonD family hydrolase n=1 Tax=Geitlerinema calcuttense NRMC-F 0142 TaxID=2922238 RepID=A0ABT7LVA7_9CYAN|nr:CocE/NonD family hydrolase [Geitlerinema calcuttense]MDL5055973.1 CocE/NonD family hydrolase [Geitlerinema calcuttense NRMC-F 0142]
MLNVLPPETASMTTRDGIRLDADIYRPEAEGEFPVLLMRQPYGRKIASTVVYAHPSWYAAHGYIVVIQDVRGRGTSQGEFRLFAHEVEDGVDTVNWAAKLPGSTGEVGMYGFSYQGMTQLYAASGKPAALKTVCPAMVGYDLYADWAYEGGAFCLYANYGWAIQLAAETARLRQDAIAFRLLYNASRNLPFYENDPRLDETLRKYAPHYYEWIEHHQPDEYWQKLSPNLQGVDLPMLHIGGWFDTFMRGTLRLYREMAARSAYLQHLVVGPWGHLPWGRKVGMMDFGADAASPVDQIQMNWFNRFLKQWDRPELEMPKVALFEMGSNQWRSHSRFPSPQPQSYYLSSTGLAGIDEREGLLGTASSSQEVIDTLVHDPWRPVPAMGGHASAPSGPGDRASIDCRSDVLTYTTVQLTEPLTLIGEMVVEVYCQADTPSYDLCAVLSEVRPDGRVFNFTQGYIRVDNSQSPVRISLQPTYMQIAKGHALRLSLSAACFPAYPVNPGTGATFRETRFIDAQIMTLSVGSGGNSPSRLLLRDL